MRTKHVVSHDGAHYGYRFDCPGCGEPHVITTKPYTNGWDFDGNEERPTFSPSVLVYSAQHCRTLSTSYRDRLSICRTCPNDAGIAEG